MTSESLLTKPRSLRIVLSALHTDYILEAWNFFPKGSETHEYNIPLLIERKIKIYLSSCVLN